MRPVQEVTAFLRAAFVDPVPRDRAESREVVSRRRIVSAVTLAAGAGVLAWSLRIEPGDATFYVGTLVLAAIWVIGSLLSGPLHLGRGNSRRGDTSGRAIVQSFVVGLLLLAIFLAGALIVAPIPFLRSGVEDLLDHARYGSLALVAVITALNGIAEEVYFRGALFAAVGRRHAVTLTTAVYVLVTSMAGIPLLAFAALILGLVVGAQRRVTGGVLAPIITHLTWSLGMLFLLPGLLDRLG